MPLKEARITGIKPEYANAYGYNPETRENDLTNTNYEIKFEGITDTLIVPYQVQINGEMYKVTEVNISVRSGYFSTPVPNIENVIFPNTVKKINVSGISWWRNNLERKTKTIKLPNKITELPDGIYASANHMTTFEIPKSVTKIGKSAFDTCTSLTSIDLPKGLTSIGEGAFGGCTGLTSISIPDGVTSIGAGAFDYCTKLASVTYKGVTYHSRNELLSALSVNNVTVESDKNGNGNFKNTALQEYDNNLPS